VDIDRTAMDANRLLLDDGLQAVFASIINAAAGVFFNPNSAISDIEIAHQKVKAVEFIKSELQSRIDAKAIADKRKRTLDRD